MCTTTITITISATAAKPYPPTISDGTLTVSDEPKDKALVTAVSTGNVVHFVKAGAITKIEIVEKPVSQDLFSVNPTAANDWKGTIGSFGKNSEEAYSINYTVGGVDYSLDPRLRMK